MKGTVTDPRAEFLARINIGDTRFRAFSGFVFLCGGENDPVHCSPVLSARHLIYRELTSGRYSDLASRLKLAEDIQDWFRDGTYSDLVTFEQHLASLSSVILLVVESPGSIAELGAFSVAEPIGKRLITVLAEQHFDSDSFIRLGPINRLEKAAERKPLVYDWLDEDPITKKLSPRFERLEPKVEEILGDVRSLLDSAYTEQVFVKNDPGHVMIMICELCDLFGALTETEIAEYICKYNDSITYKEISQFLFLLQKCSVLRQKPVGHGRYYYAPDWKPHITFSFSDSRRVDRDRVRVTVFEYYVANVKSRADVVKQIRGLR